MPSLSTSFGRGAATSFQADLQHSDCILIMGSNMAEAHPVGFRFPMKARERGARVIHVDPRFSRTSACATDYVPIRAGSDIVFLGGLIHQVLTQERWFRDYVLAYTNATTIISDDYVDAEEFVSMVDAALRENDPGLVAKAEPAAAVKNGKAGPKAVPDASPVTPDSKIAPPAEKKTLPNPGEVKVERYRLTPGGLIKTP